MGSRFVVSNLGPFSFAWKGLQYIDYLVLGRIPKGRTCTLMIDDPPSHMPYHHSPITIRTTATLALPSGRGSSLESNAAHIDYTVAADKVFDWAYSDNSPDTLHKQQPIFSHHKEDDAMGPVRSFRVRYQLLASHPETLADLHINRSFCCAPEICGKIMSWQCLPFVLT